MAFIRFQRQSTNSSTTRYTPWSTGQATVGTENGARSFIPLATTISEATLRGTTAVTGVQRYDTKFQVALVDSGATMQLTSATDSGLSVRATLGASLPAMISSANASAQRHLVTTLPTSAPNAPPSQITRLAYAYNVTAAEDISWYGFNDDTEAVTLAGTDRYFALEWAGAAGTATTTTQSVAQMTWPATGSFKYLLARYIVPTPASDVRIALQVNSADSIILDLPSTAGAGAVDARSDLTTIAPVTAGQPVNFRYIRTSSTGGTIAMLVIIGFSGTAA